MTKLSDRLEALAEKATKGHWQLSGVRHSGDLKIGNDTRLHAIGPDGDAVAMVFYDMKTGNGLLDAKLLVELVNNLPTILQALEDKDL